MWEENQLLGTEFLRSLESVLVEVKTEEAGRIRGHKRVWILWSPSVLVSLGSITRYQRLDGLCNGNVFSHHCGSWKFHIKVLISCGLSPWLPDGCLLSVSPHGLSFVYSDPFMSLSVLGASVLLG